MKPSSLRAVRSVRPNQFDRLISKLDSVIKNESTGNGTIRIYSNKPVTVKLEDNNSQFCEVNIKGMKTPMVININRIKGECVRTLIYKRFPEIYEKYSTDTITITDKSYEFQLEKLFIRFCVEEDSLFQVKLQFGQSYRRIPRKKNVKENGEESCTYIEEDSLDKKIKNEQSKRMSRINYVERNKSMQSCRTLIQNRSVRVRFNRLENVIKSRHKFIDRPIKKALKSQVSLIKSKKYDKTVLVKQYFVSLVMLSSTRSLADMHKIKAQEKREELRKEKAARCIQRFVRYKFKGNMLLANNVLTNYYAIRASLARTSPRNSLYN